MSIVVGRVIGIKGEVLILDTETQEVRAVSEGAELFLNEVVITQNGATVAIETVDGNTLSIGSDSQFVIDNDVVPVEAFQELPPQLVGNFDSLQRAIVEGRFESVDGTEVPLAAEQQAAFQTQAEVINQSNNTEEELSSSNQQGVEDQRNAETGEITAGYVTETREIDFVEEVEPPARTEELVAPTPEPTEVPTPEPTELPTEAPTLEPTEPPTEAPTPEPTEPPTEAPTPEPTEPPTEAPTPQPTEPPTEEPTPEPTQPPPPPRTIIKVIAADAEGNPLKDQEGNYLEANAAPEGGQAYYVALAFAPNSTLFNDNTRLETQAGTVDFAFADDSATRNSDQEPAEGSNDYLQQETLEGIALNTRVSADALDDYISDNGELFNVTISNYQSSSPAAYVAVSVREEGVETTITDNSIDNESEVPNDPTDPNDLNDGDEPNNPDDGDENTPPTNAEPVIIKLIALDGNGEPILNQESGHYTFANQVTEGNDANYMALAFASGETVFSPDTKLTNQLGTVDISFGAEGDSATGAAEQTVSDGSEDYDNSQKTAVALGSVISTSSFSDIIRDNEETYKITINQGSYTRPTPTTGYEDVVIDQAPVTTTILDNEQNVFVKIINNDTQAESNFLSHTLQLVDDEGNPITVANNETITVTLTYSPAETDGAIEKADGVNNADYISTKSVTIAGGTSETTFYNEALDDYFAENDEQYKVTIDSVSQANNTYENVALHTSANGAQSDAISVTGTIIDNPAQDTQNPNTPNEPTDSDNPNEEDTIDNTPVYGPEDSVYVTIIESDSVFEGNDLNHFVQLIDKDGNAVVIPDGETLTLTLTYATITGTLTATDFENGSNQYNENSAITVTLDKDTPKENGIYKLPISNATIDDFNPEGDEAYSLTITDVVQANDTFENVVIGALNGDFKSVTGTIKDGVNIGNPDNAYVDEDNFDVTAPTNTITDSKTLNIVAPNGDNSYELIFDGIPSFVSEEANFNTADGDQLTSNGMVIEYVVSGNTTTAYSGAGRANSDKVFEITLNKNGKGGDNDDYTYTQFKNIDHPVSGNGDANQDDDDIVLTFGYKIEDDGQTSSVKTFTVTVNDSLPAGEDQILTVNEDDDKLIVISDESFKDGEIEINNNAGTTTTLNTTNNTTINIFDADQNDIVGTLTNNGDGSLSFNPIDNYSGPTSGFSYTVSDTDGDTASASVSISVTPKSDAPTISDGGAETWEDTAVTINLKAPVVTDDTDKNETGGPTAGDYPEKLGLISLKNMAVGVQILKGDDNSSLWESNGTNDKLYVLLSDGEHTQDAITLYTNNSGQANYLSMTTDEFEALKINPVSQAHNDIDIKMSVTSYEVDASGNKLPDADTVGTNGSTTNKTFHVEVKAVTDDISLIFDNNADGVISNTHRDDDTYTADVNLNEGDGAIDLQAVLTATSGQTDDLSDKSEKLTYIFEGIPSGTLVQLGSNVATANNSGYASVTLKSTDYAEDPSLTMTLPTEFAGEVEAKVTLSVKDTDGDSSGFTIDTKTQVVYFNVDIDPVADLATLQVKQSKGFEDAGRSGGNTSAQDGTINAPDSAILLDIKVTSDDTDGSETFTVRIDAIPDSGSLYVYDNSTSTWKTVSDAVTGVDGNLTITDNGNGTWKIEIKDFQNDQLPFFIPPHNSDEEYTLKVNSKTIDTVTINGVDADNESDWLVTDKDIDVFVRGVADVPVGTELKGFDIDGNSDNANGAYNLVLEENTGLDNSGNEFNLSEIYQAPESLDSYDSDSETLSVVISNLTNGFGVVGASMIGAGKWTFLADDVDNIKITTPANFSGEATFDLKYVTTEREGDSKTNHTDTVKIFVSPTAEASLNDSSSGKEDVLFKVDLGINHQNGDTNETLEQVRIKAIDVDNQDFTLFIGNSTNTAINTLTPNAGGYYELSTEQANNIYAKNTDEHDIGAGSFTFRFGYTVKDTENNQGTSDEKVVNDIDYTLTIKAVTDNPTAEDGLADGSGTGYSISGSTVTVEQPNTTFSIPVTLTTPDQDGTESAVQYVITGVPMGVEVVGGTYYGYAGSPHNGIWVLDIADQVINDANGHTQSVEFKVNVGSDFENRNITIEAFNQDTGASLESDTVTFTLEKVQDYEPGTGTGNPAEFTLQQIDAQLLEDTEFNLGSVLQVTGTDGSGNSVITLSNLPAGTNVSGADYSYTDADGTHYVVLGAGNAADMNTQLSAVKIMPPLHVNDSDNSGSGSMTFDATIATSDQGTYGPDSSLSYAEHLLPVTDEMTIEINVSDTQEDTDTDFTVTLSNTADQVTDIIDDKLYIKFSENYEVGETAKGELWYNGAKMTVTENVNGNDYFVVDVSGYIMGNAIDFTFKPGEDRHGQVSFDVLVQNKEGHDWDTNVHDTAVQDSTESATIQVAPVIDGLENGQANDVSGDESTGADLNRIKMDFGGNLTDPSESIGSLTLDKIPNGFLIFYGADANNLSMATNIGQSETYQGTFELNPNGDSELVNFNQWLIPLDNGQIPQEIWIQAPQNWSGDLNEVLLNLFSVNDGSQTSNENYQFDVTYNPAADGLTIDPTLTFGVAYNWIDIKLNANMIDVDGSETMTLTLSAANGSEALNDSMLFRLIDSTEIDASFNNGIYTIEDISYDQINNLQMLYQDYNGTIDATAKSVDGNSESNPLASGNFNLQILETNTIDLSGESRGIPVTGTDSGDSITGGSGDDDIDAGSDNDTINAGDGNDTIEGGAGNDTITGGDGDDVIDGGTGNDTITGGDGVDNIDGGDGNDTITGGSGNDVIDGGADTDTVIYSGNITNYQFSYDFGTSTLTISGAEGTDTLSNVEKLTFNGTTYTLVISNGNIDVQGNNELNLIISDLDNDDTIEADGTDWIVSASTAVNGTPELFSIVDAKEPDDANTANIDESNDGVIIDGIIEGMSYRTSSGMTGVTEANGGFKYKTGDTVTFSIGGVVIGTATDEDLDKGNVFLQDLANTDRTDLEDDYVQVMAVFLQTLDSEGNTAGGIQISDAAHQAFADESLHLSSMSLADVNAFLTSHGYTPVDVETAMEHVMDMLVANTELSEEDFTPLELQDEVVEEETLESVLQAIEEVEDEASETAGDELSETESTDVEDSVPETTSNESSETEIDEAVPEETAVEATDEAISDSESTEDVNIQESADSSDDGDSDNAEGSVLIEEELMLEPSTEVEEGSESEADEAEMPALSEMLDTGEDNLPLPEPETDDSAEEVAPEEVIPASADDSDSGDHSVVMDDKPAVVIEESQTDF